MSFDNLGLSKALLRAIEEKGYKDPSPIQEKAIPPVLNKRDVMASAQTGTGKTAGFVLPIIQLLNKKPVKGRRKVRALILTPTRELAAQILDEVKSFTKHIDLKSTVIFGGVKQHSQVKSIQAGIDILVATPGRLLDLCGQGILSLRAVEMFVLDEADRMLDMGFVRDIHKVINLMPERRQNLMFSATFSASITKLAHTFLDNPVRIAATPENTTVEIIQQKVYRVNQKQKTAFVIKLILDGNWHQVLIFTRTKHGANRLSGKLERAKITSAAIHGNKSQGARTRALAAFKNGDVSVLVATDIAARGIDIPLLPHVINFELPNVPEDYVHRIGRTGRAGAGGEAISLVSGDEIAYLKSIEKLVKRQIPSEIVEGFEPTSGPVEGGKKRMQQQRRNSNNSGNRNKKKPYGDRRSSGNNSNSYHGKKRKNNSRHRNNNANRNKDVG